MKLKLFGKDLFEFSRSGQLAYQAINDIKETKYLHDFYKLYNRGGSNFDTLGNSWTTISTTSGGLIATQDTGIIKEKKKEEDKKKLSPKEIFQLKTLDNKGFKINTNKQYIEDQINSFKDKLDMLRSDDFDMRNGVIEVASIILRMENRKKYPEFEKFYGQFPYTSTGKISDLVKEHDYLKIDGVSAFLADMPKEASDTMKEYTKQTEKLCGKKPVFYIIADKKDFEKTDKRRDPILLAQSPFSHAWQILGAWDEEMLLLEDL